MVYTMGGGGGGVPAGGAHTEGDRVSCPSRACISRVGQGGGSKEGVTGTQHVPRLNKRRVIDTSHDCSNTMKYNTQNVPLTGQFIGIFCNYLCFLCILLCLGSSVLSFKENLVFN